MTENIDVDDTIQKIQEYLSAKEQELGGHEEKASFLLPFAERLDFLSARQLKKILKGIEKWVRKRYQHGHELRSLLTEEGLEAYVGSTTDTKNLPNDHQKEIINKFTAGVITGINSDIRNAEEETKYSIWIGAIATAGLATIVFRGEKLVIESMWASLLATALLLAAVVLTAVVRHRFTVCSFHQRVQQAQFGSQELQLLSGHESTISDSLLLSKLQTLGFADDSGRLRHILSDHLITKLDSSPLISVQQWLTLSGYILIIGLSFYALLPTTWKCLLFGHS